MANLYETLNVDPSASHEAIDQAYLKLKKEYRGSDTKTASYDHAYSVLSDEGKRQAYDIGLTEAAAQKKSVDGSRTEVFENDADGQYKEPWERQDSSIEHMKWGDLGEKFRIAWNGRPHLSYFLTDIAWWAWPVVFTLAFIWLTVFDSNPIMFLFASSIVWGIWKMIQWQRKADFTRSNPE
jgi:hypothetical protein